MNKQSIGKIMNALWSKLYKFVIFNSGFNDIAKDAVVPDSTQFVHKGIGVVIGSKTVLGENVTIYQNVTTGNRFSNLGDGPAPVIGNNVIIFANACILGGITIGDNSVIGAHSLVLEDVPPNSVVYGVPAKVIKNRSKLSD